MGAFRRIPPTYGRSEPEAQGPRIAMRSVNRLAANFPCDNASGVVLEAALGGGTARAALAGAGA